MLEVFAALGVAGAVVFPALFVAFAVRHFAEGMFVAFGVAFAEALAFTLFFTFVFDLDATGDFAADGGAVGEREFEGIGAHCSAVGDPD